MSKDTFADLDAEKAYVEALAKAMALENVADNLRAMSHMPPNSLRIGTDTYNKVLTDMALEMTNRAVYARQAFNKIKEG
jgi:hypothetical protein